MTKFASELQNNIVKIPIVLGLDDFHIPAKIELESPKNTS